MKCDPATALFVIADGQVKTSLVTLDGDEVIFDHRRNQRWGSGESGVAQ
jgi:hypothetical protein